jgi:hypothetical protein
MALDFPSPASPGQIYSYGIYTWEYNGTYWNSISTNSFLSTSGGTVTGDTVFTSGLTATTISATTYQNLPVSAVTNGTGISASTTNGVTTITNTDLGSSQNIFKNIQITGTTQFSAGSNNSNLNFSGINLTITSAATNTLVFSAGTGGVSGSFLPTSGGTITGNLIVTGNTNVSGTTTSTGNVTTLQNLQSLYSVGDEGGEILLSKPQTNTSISGTGVTIDIFQNRLRFFEQGGSNRGAFIDLTSATNGVGSNLLNAGTTDYYTIIVNQGGFNPADSVTYYIGQGGYAPSTTVNTRNVSIPFTSTLTNVTINSGAANAASTENSTVSFRLNNTTETTLSSVVKFSGGNAQSNGATLTYNISGLSISVNAGDFFEIKVVSPIWVTNPTSASLTMMLFFRR